MKGLNRVDSQSPSHENDRKDRIVSISGGDVSGSFGLLPPPMLRLMLL